MTGVKVTYEMAYNSLKHCLNEDPREYNFRDWSIGGYREFGLKQFNNGNNSVKADQLHLATVALLEFHNLN